MKRIIISILLLALLSTSALYIIAFLPNVNAKSENSGRLFYIHTGSDYRQVLSDLQQQQLLINTITFQAMAYVKKYNLHVKPGKYRLKRGMSNNQLVNILRGGIQEPVVLNLNQVHTREQLASRLSRKLEIDSTQLIQYLNNPAFYSKYGFSLDNCMCFFIPDNYEVLWNISLNALFDRFAQNYKATWSLERKNKAKSLDLSQAEVTILASIVQAEQSRFDDEKPIIAGLYLNRLKKNMPLQSDPTLIYARNDFTLNRVINADKTIESPYNTYKYKGLPPGPIILPEVSSIDAVLNYTPSDYLYMCAKDDLSGRHNFSATYDKQINYARQYREALDKRGIHR